MNFRFPLFPGMLLTAALSAVTGIAYAEDLKTSRNAFVVTDTPGSTLIEAKANRSDRSLTLRLDWKTGDESPQNFQKKSKDDVLVSTYRLGQTTITRTIVVDEETDAVFIHALADQPGAVHVSARFATEKAVSIVDRREIRVSDEEISARAWIIPFESDVEDDGKSTVSVSGEGEVLVIFSLSDDPEKAPVDDLLKKLGEKYDPGRIPPSPHLIWKGANPKE